MIRDKDALRYASYSDIVDPAAKNRKVTSHNIVDFECQRYGMNEPPHNITIIGDGAMATVVAILMHERGCAVNLFCPLAQNAEAMIQTRVNDQYLPGFKLPSRIRIASQPDVSQTADLIINAIPTQYIRQTWIRLADSYPSGIPVVSVAKGIENQTLLRPTQIITEVLVAAKKTPGSLAALSGPTIAGELARRMPATMCAASDDPELAKHVQQLATTDWLRIYTNHDLLGVELAGAGKNVIAIAAGVVDGLAAGYNAKSALLARGLAEITRLGVAMGADAQTFFGITGVGDLATTCFCPEGRNRTCGEYLGQGLTIKEALKKIPGVVEGVDTTVSLCELAEKFNVEMPITQAVHRVIFEQLDPLAAIGQLMTRERKHEKVG